MMGLLSRLAIVLLAGTAVGQSPFDDTAWHKYVRSPPSTVVKPRSIISDKTTGQVFNPSGLLDGSNPTVFTRNSQTDTIPSVVVDFGQNVVGALILDFAGSSNLTGSPLPGLKLAFSESLEYLSDRSDYTRSDRASGDQKITPGTDQVQVKNEAHEWTDTWSCLTDSKVCADGLHAFRYLRISLDAYDGDAQYVGSTGVVSINSVSLNWIGYLGTPDTFTGWFDCSDSGLAQLFYDGVYTVDMGTAVFTIEQVEPRGAASSTLEGKQVLLDGAKRDRDPYVGDLTVASKTSYVSHNFSEASLNVLEDLVQRQREDGYIPPASISDYSLPLFDYPLHWVVSAVDYILYTGNLTFAETYWNNLQNVFDEYYAPKIVSSGLLEKDASLGLGDYAFIGRSGPITYYNALYVYAMRYAARLAVNLNHTDDASNWEARADSISAALLQHNLDPGTGAFFDGGPCPNDPAGTICPIHAQDGNGIAVLANVTSTAQASVLLDWYAHECGRPYGNAFYDSDRLGTSYSQLVYPFISYFEIAARLQTPGQASSGFDEIRRMWGWLAAQDPGTFWEALGPDGQPYEGPITSLSHGWSTGITSILSNYVLGVTPTSPGFNSWTVNPVIQDSSVTWAKGLVPTPSGPIGVYWNSANGVLNITIEAPSGTQGLIYVPTEGFGSWSVLLNGEDVSQSGNVIPR